MATKETLTNTEVKDDIITALKYPPKMAKSSYIISITAVYLIYIIPLILAPVSVSLTLMCFFIVCLGSVLFLIGRSVFIKFYHQSRIKKLTLDDYYICTQIVSDTSKEHYKEFVSGTKHSQAAHVYTIHFENGKSWRIPEYNYMWRDAPPMHDRNIYQSTDRNDTMIVVQAKRSKKIVMAYHTNFFEYNPN